MTQTLLDRHDERQRWLSPSSHCNGLLKGCRAYTSSTTRADNLVLSYSCFPSSPVVCFLVIIKKKVGNTPSIHAPIHHGSYTNTWQTGGSWWMDRLLRGLFNDEVGTSAWAGGWPGPAERQGGQPWKQRRRRPLSGGGSDGGMICGEAGCLHCGFTSVNSRPLFTTIINCSIIQMIFTRANYTGPCRENGLSVLLLHSQAAECTREAVQAAVEIFGRTYFFSGSVPTVTEPAINYPAWFQLLDALFGFVYFLQLP